MKNVHHSRGLSSAAHISLFSSPSIAQKHSQIPHGLVEHKARPILDPALYSERYIKQDPALLPKTGGWVCRHHSS
jgi:hypothetical protein